MKSFEKVFLSLFVLLPIFVSEIESGREGGIRNFKFRKKDPPPSSAKTISNPKSMDLRRYHDGEKDNQIMKAQKRNPFN